MNGINTARIKEKFYRKLREEKAVKNKKIKFSSIMATAAAISLMSITVLAANLGVFDNLFQNFADVAPYVRPVGKQSQSSGITMELASYLADDEGIVAKLIFTKDDGTAFAADDVRAVGSMGVVGGIADPMDILIEYAPRWAAQSDKVSDDGLRYYSMPIVNFFGVENTIDAPITISASRLVYNLSSSFETVEFDFYAAFRESEVQTLDLTEHDDLHKLFENVPDNPVHTESGVIIHSVVFANVNVAPPELTPRTIPAERSGLPKEVDGVDLGGWWEENNIIGIRYTRRLVEDGREYDFTPGNLPGNDSRFRMGLGIFDNISYIFYRVADFEDLANIEGINFSISGSGVIEGDWRIETTFSSNKETSEIPIGKVLDTGRDETALTLVSAEVSLFSTRLVYDVMDMNGHLVTEISGEDFNNYYLLAMSPDNLDLRLLYQGGEEIPLTMFWADLTMFWSGYRFGTLPAGIIIANYNMTMNLANYSLMNTGRLLAIVVNGERFYVE